MVKEKLNADSHVYLYAKKHYVKSKNPFNDLRKIYALRNGVDAQFISDGDILGMMLTLTYQHIKSEYAFEKFVCGMFKTYKRHAILPHFGIANKKKLLWQMLSALALTQVLDGDKVLIPLDEPDFTILPSHKEYIAKRMKKGK